MKSSLPRVPKVGIPLRGGAKNHRRKPQADTIAEDDDCFLPASPPQLSDIAGDISSASSKLGVAPASDLDQIAMIPLEAGILAQSIYEEDDCSLNASPLQISTITGDSSSIATASGDLNEIAMIPSEASIPPKLSWKMDSAMGGFFRAIEELNDAIREVLLIQQRNRPGSNWIFFFLTILAATTLAFSLSAALIFVLFSDLVREGIGGNRSEFNGPAPT